MTLRVNDGGKSQRLIGSSRTESSDALRKQSSLKPFDRFSDDARGRASLGFLQAWPALEEAFQIPFDEPDLALADQRKQTRHTALELLESAIGKLATDVPLECD